MARKASDIARKTSDAANTGFGVFWIHGDPGEDEPWPSAPTRLEMLAESAGVSDEEYAARLRGAIQVRLREKAAAEERLDRMLEKRANGS